MNLAQTTGTGYGLPQFPGMFPGQTPGMLPGQQMPGYQTPQGPPPSFVSPRLGGWIAGIAAAGLTYYLLGKLEGKAIGKKTIPMSNKIKIPAALVVGLIVKQGVQKRIEHAELKKQAGAMFGYQFGGMQVPQGSYTLPPSPGVSGTITTGAFDPERKAGELINAYNPEGWNTDEDLLLETVLTVPPKSFALVANAYTQLYGRNLLNDLDEQLNSWVHQVAWQNYRKQIP